MFCNPTITTNETLKEELLRELTEMLTTEVIPIIKEDLEMIYTIQIDSLKADNQFLNQKILDINAALNDSKENKENEMFPDIIDKLVIKFTSQIDGLKADNLSLNQKILDISTAVKTPKESEEDEKDNQNKKKTNNPKKKKENEMIPNITDGLVIKFISQIENLKADNQLINQKILDFSAAVKNPAKESKEIEKDSQTKKKTKKKTAVENDHNATLRLLRKKKIGKDEADKSGGTPLYQAATNGHNDFVRTQPDVGADTGKTDNYSRTSLTKTANNRHHYDVGILPLHRNGVTPLYQSVYNGLKTQTPPNNLRLTVHDRLALTDTFASAARKSTNHRKGRRNNSRNNILPASKARTDYKKHSFKLSTPSAGLNLNRSTSDLRASSTKMMMRNSVQKHSNLIQGKTKWNTFLRLSQTEIQS